MHTPQNFTINGIAYNTTSEYTVEVTSGGFYEGRITIPKSVIYESKTYKVDAIGDDAFNECEKLNSVSIPKTVKEIGKFAFRGCANLSKISIPNSVISIDNFAFSCCISLNSIYIPYSVSNIKGNVFEACENLTGLAVSTLNPAFKSSGGVLFDKTMETLVSFPTGKITGDYIIPDTVKRIGESAFADCINLYSVSIPDSVKQIDESAFHGCFGLTNITFSNSVVNIVELTFASCKNLRSFTIPNSVTNIEDSAFCDCENLSSITIPESVLRIEHSVFDLCPNLTNLIVNESNPNYSSQNGVLFDKTMEKLIKFPTGKISNHYKIPASVKEIADSAFSYSKELFSVDIPNSVERIGRTAFTDCTDLNKVFIPDSVKIIGAMAFSNCSNLKSITISNSDTNIECGAFYYCENLEEFHYRSSVPYDFINEIHPELFFKGINQSTCVLFVPKGSKQAYKLAKLWQDFENIVEEEEDL